jgi:hypothetical protein
VKNIEWKLNMEKKLNMIKKKCSKKEEKRIPLMHPRNGDGEKWRNKVEI